MAREKMHSTSAEEVATSGGQEREPQPTTPSKNHPNASFKKKQSNKRNTNEMAFAAVVAAGITTDSDSRSVNSTSTSSNHRHDQSHQQHGHKKASLSNANSPSHKSRISLSPTCGSKGSQTRSNKTLAWFISDEQLRSVSSTGTSNTTTKNSEKSKRTSSSAVVLSSDTTGMKETTDKMLSNRQRRPSLNNSTNSNRNSDNHSSKTTHFDERKRGKRTRQRPQKKLTESKSSSYNTNNSNTNNNNANNNADSPNHNINNSEDTRDAKQPTTKGDCNKDDYWYYDPTSDGFYYENMGSRGWRRRLPVNAQKRTRMEQEMYATFLRDPSQFAGLQPDMYGFLPQVATANAAAAYYAGPQIKYYDPASDGYYFEMPSVDGWKRRQPNSSSTSSSNSASGSSSASATAGMIPATAAFLSCSNGTGLLRGASFLHYHAAQQQEPQVTSYGAALARGQLPPAYKLADSAVCSQDPFSSGASSMSTLSSLSEGTPTPPPLSGNHLHTMSSNRRNDSSMFCDEENYIDYLAEQCDRALQLDDMTNEDDSDCCINEMVHLPSCLFDRPESPEIFTASSCDSDDLENTPPNKESLELKRPGTLDLNAEPSLIEISDNIEEKETSKTNDETKSNSKHHELLLNFNADKFIADSLAHYGSNVERVLRDLAALKTPVTPATTTTAGVTTPSCNLDSPRTPAIYSAYPNWARAPDTALSNACNDWWLRDATNSAYIEDIWSGNDASTAYSSTKSKLSIWRDSGLLTAVPCDNN